MGAEFPGASEDEAVDRRAWGWYRSQKEVSMSSSAFHVVYDGPGLASHELDVRTLAPALIALSDAFEEANTLVNGERAKITLNVKASFKTGSFGIDLSVVQGIKDSLVNFLSQKEVVAAATLVSLLGFAVMGKNGLLQVVKWIGNRRISKIEPQGSGVMRLYIGDKFIDTEEAVIQMLRSERIRRALDDAIRKPLEQQGIDAFGFTDDVTEKRIEYISKEEAVYYTAPVAEPEDLGESEYETTLQIISPTFQDNNKWRFSDGSSSTFYADMLDKDFLTQIDNHQILFGKGDIIRAVIRERKVLESGGVMRGERAILKVLDHRNAIVQLRLTDIR
jgi:hypothetical protein